MVKPKPLSPLREGYFVKEMQERVRRIVRDLSTLQADVMQVMRQHPFQQIEEILTPEVTAEFKLAVDAMRHLLYESGASPSSAGGSLIEKVEAIMKKIRLQEPDKD
jgi:hypothetical protein